jgi:murein DD-endopeptidase MepM/ murein hydrolase activator NlpD
MLCAGCRWWQGMHYEAGWSEGGFTMRRIVLDGIRTAAWIALALAAGAAQAFETPATAFDLPQGGALLIATHDTRDLPSTVSCRDGGGAELWSARVPRLSDPVISPRGRFAALRAGQEIRVYDLNSGTYGSRPNGGPYTVDDRGRLAVVLPSSGAGADEQRVLWVGHPQASRRILLPAGFMPQQIRWDEAARAYLLLGAGELIRVDDAGRDLAVIHRASEGWRLWDITLEPGPGRAATRYHITARRSAQDWIEEADWVLDSATLDVVGAAMEERVVRRTPRPRGDDLPRTRNGLRWPTEPNSQNPIGNTYGEYQNYGGAPYMHPGVDVMGEAGQPIYAVASGWVKAILTTSGQWHWRVAVGDSSGTEPCGGYLYAHLAQNSIAVQVGDYVQEGDYLGGLVDWPVAGFTHIHFARIADAGVQWYGNWVCTDNPHLDFVGQDESEAPLFEPARGNDLLAFCRNETATYLEPDALSGEVDIIVHVGDRILTDWVCTVQEIRYTIYSLQDPGHPVVDDLLGIYYDMALDTYQGGPIDPLLVDLFYKQDGTCNTRGDYDAREFFYIITNSNGDLVYEESDFLEAWDTRVIPDGEYVVRVTALDVAGNAAVDSMLVTVANGYSDVSGPRPAAAPLPRILLATPCPNPAQGASQLAFELPAAQRLEIGVYDVAGRLVRHLTQARMSAGAHELAWDGRNAAGERVAPGIYFYCLRGEDGSYQKRVVMF